MSEYARCIAALAKGHEHGIDQDATIASLDARVGVSWDRLEFLSSEWDQLLLVLTHHAEFDSEQFVEAAYWMSRQGEYYHGGDPVRATREWFDAGHAETLYLWIDAGVFTPEDVPEGADPKDILAFADEGRPIYWFGKQAIGDEWACNAQAYEDAARELPEGMCSEAYGVLAFVSAISRSKFDELDADIHDARRPSHRWMMVLEQFAVCIADYEQDPAEALSKHIARWILSDQLDDDELRVARAALRIAEKYRMHSNRWTLAAMHALDNHVWGVRHAHSDEGGTP